MEVLKPEVYWIGKRCYRVNPCQGNHQHNYDSVPTGEGDVGAASTSKQGTTAPLKPYTEVDEFEDAIGGPDEDSHEQTIEVIKVQDNAYKVVCSIPSPLFRSIIGFKNNVRKRIESETGTRVFVPLPNEKGDVIIQGPNEADVRKAFQRVDQVAVKARFRQDATHFVCFPMNDSAVVQKAKEFKEAVLANCAVNSRSLDQSIFQVPEKLHFTICILMLLDKRERTAAANILSSLEPEIKQLTEGKCIKIQLKGLEIMNDDPSQVDVLYAKCNPVENGNAIQEIANLVARKFAEKQLGKEAKGEQVKLHCTIINTRYRSESMNTDRHRGPDSRRQDGNSNSRESFDARSILQKYGEFDFGMVDVKEVKIATRHTKGPDDFYKCYTSIKI